MGSFNITCFASMQTIAPGDVCYALPLLQKSGSLVKVSHNGKEGHLKAARGSDCYPDAFWRPFGRPIEGRYEDYGHVSLRDTPTNTPRVLHLIHRLLKRAPVVHEGDNQYHDLPFDLAHFISLNTVRLQKILDNPEMVVETRHRAEVFHEMSAVWDYIWEVAGKHRLFAFNDASVAMPFEFAVVHKAAHDCLVKRSAAELMFDKSAKHEDVFARAMFALTQAEAGTRPEREVELAIGRFRAEIYHLSHFSPGLFDGEETELPMHLHRYLRKEMSKDELFEAFKPILDTRHFIGGLAGFNIKITPVVTTGQDYDNSIGRGYAEFVRSVSTLVTKQRR